MNGSLPDSCCAVSDQYTLAAESGWRDDGLTFWGRGAGGEHRFEEFSDDLVVWVIFYGPDGGDREEAQR